MRLGTRHRRVRPQQPWLSGAASQLKRPFWPVFRLKNAKRTKWTDEKDWNGPIRFSPFSVILRRKTKKAHKCCNFQKKCLSLSRQLRKTGDIEESIMLWPAKGSYLYGYRSARRRRRRFRREIGERIFWQRMLRRLTLFVRIRNTKLQNAENMKNPWLSITEGKIRIATCDIPFFESEGSAESYAEKINQKDDEVELTFDCMPDPFCGNPDSKVYCLNKNPGKPDPNFTNDEVFKEATIKNLLLEQNSCFWAENIRNNCGKLHIGVEWLRKRTKVLEGILGSHPNIFFIEYFPYHSTSGFDFPDNLPSYEFSNYLTKKAMDEGKTIILMRERDRWLKRIKDLASYPHLYTLRCAQGGYLTPKNIIRYVTHILSKDEIKTIFQL